MDISRRALQQLDRPGRRLVEADLAQPLGQIAAASDAVLALDVIEHLDDDRAAVARLGMLVRPGVALIVSVPALPALFTEFDAIQGHRRRYLPETLGAAFADSGLLLDRIFWWGRWLVPALRRHRASPRSRPARRRRRSTAIISNCLPGHCPGSPNWRSCSSTARPSAGYCGLVHHCSRWPAAPATGRPLQLAWQNHQRDHFPRTGAVLAVPDRAGSALRGPGCSSPVRAG